MLKRKTLAEFFNLQEDYLDKIEEILEERNGMQNSEDEDYVKVDDKEEKR